MTSRLGNQSFERRRQPRGGTSEPPRAQLVTMVLGTFREMPGLCLHVNQAARLFGVHSGTCQVVLDDLVAKGHLRRAHDGQYLARDVSSRAGSTPNLPTAPRSAPATPRRSA